VKFGKYMIIYGGANDNGNALNELLCLDMKNEAWIELNLVNGKFISLFKEYGEDLEDH
jgi:hypothetical protein